MPGACVDYEEFIRAIRGKRVAKIWRLIKEEKWEKLDRLLVSRQPPRAEIRRRNHIRTRVQRNRGK